MRTANNVWNGMQVYIAKCRICCKPVSGHMVSGMIWNISQYHAGMVLGDGCGCGKAPSKFHARQLGDKHWGVAPPTGRYNRTDPNCVLWRNRRWTPQPICAGAPTPAASAPWSWVPTSTGRSSTRWPWSARAGIASAGRAPGRRTSPPPATR